MVVMMNKLERAIERRPIIVPLAVLAFFVIVGTLENLLG